MPPERVETANLHILLLRVLAWSLVAGSCRSSPESVTSPLRFIERDPQTVSSLDELMEAKTWLEWRFDHPQPDWTVGGRSLEVPPTDGIVLSAEKRTVLQSQGVEFDAATADAILIELDGELRQSARIRLHWDRSGETLSAERTVLARPPASATPSGQTVRFPMQGHPYWTGTISSLRISFPPSTAVVTELRLVEEEPAPERMAELVDGFKAGVGDEVRNALLAIPGVPTEKALTVPRDARLRFSYALYGASYVPVRFVVSFETEEGESTELFGAVLDQSSAPTGWRQAEVALGEHAGRRGRLRLATESEGAFSLTQGLPLWGNPEVTFAGSSRPNIVLVSIDTLRSDRMSLYGYERPTTPNLEAWARDLAAVFRTAVAQSPWTLPSHVSMLSGLDPFSHGVNHSSDTAPASLVMLAEVLREAGYSTLAVTGGTLLHPRYGFSQGFDRYWYYSESRATGRELATELDQALAWLDERQGSPFFLFFHTYEVHTPYRSRSPYYESFTDLPPVEDVRIEIPEPEESDGYLWKVDPSNVRVVRPKSLDGLEPSARVELASAAYDSGIAYADELLTRLLDKVRETRAAGDTIVVLTSDHGEMLGEHGLVSHRYLYEENILVPLLIAAPGGRGRGRVIPDQVRSIDIVPTILELAGLAAPADIDGSSLVPLLDGDPSPVPREAWTYVPESNYGLSLRWANRLKYVFNDTAWSPIHGRESLYALEPSADERESVAAPLEMERFRRRAKVALAETPGIRVRFENGGEAAFSGTISGDLISFDTVKSLDLPCPCVALDRSRLDFRVPAGESYALTIAGGGKGPLALTLATAEGAPEPFRFERRFTLEEVLDSKVVGLAASGWHELDRQRPPTRVELRWHGPRPLDEPDIAPDSRLTERLRALGYLN